MNVKNKQYADGFKRRMVERMTGPRAVSAYALAREVGVPQPTLSLWRRRAATLGTNMPGDQRKPEVPRRAEDWSAEEKLQAVVEAEKLSDAQLGGWLRQRGVTQAHLSQWREAAVGAFASSPRPSPSTDHKRIRELERELRRKDKALAEAAALLVLQGKVQALWAAEDEPTGPSNASSSSKQSRPRSRKERG